MAASNVDRLVFHDGHVCHRDRIALASQFARDAHISEGTEFSRLATIVDVTTTPRWLYGNLDDVALSVTHLDTTNQTFFLGKRGRLRVLSVDAPADDPNRRVTETIPTETKHGWLLRIRAIAGRVYCCGMTGQIWARGSAGWAHMDAGVLGREGIDLEDVDGTGPDDLYAVGMGGSIFHFDGQAWQQLESPTRRPLSSVCCVSRDDVYVCGSDGGFFHRSSAGWHDLRDARYDANFWGLADYRGRRYLATAGGIVVHDGSGFEAVDFGIAPPKGCHRLHAKDGVLWSFGIDDLVYLDGAKWTRVGCPLNG
jgi:hypothetical protein